MMPRNSLCAVGASLVVALVGMTCNAFAPLAGRSRPVVGLSLRMAAPYYNDRDWDDRYDDYDDDYGPSRPRRNAREPGAFGGESNSDYYARVGSGSTRHLRADNDFNPRHSRPFGPSSGRREDEREMDYRYNEESRRRGTGDWRDDEYDRGESGYYDDEFIPMDREPQWERPANQFSDYSAGTQQREYRYNDGDFQSDRLLDREPSNFERGRNQFSDYPDPRTAGYDITSSRYDDDLDREDTWERQSPNDFGSPEPRRRDELRGPHVRNHASERGGAAYAGSASRVDEREPGWGRRASDPFSEYPSDRMLPSSGLRSNAAEREGTYYSTTDSTARNRNEDRDSDWERPGSSRFSDSRESSPRGYESGSRGRYDERDDYGSRRRDDRNPDYGRDEYSRRQSGSRMTNDGARASGYDERERDFSRRSGRDEFDDGPRSRSPSSRESGSRIMSDRDRSGGYGRDSSRRDVERERDYSRRSQDDFDDHSRGRSPSSPRESGSRMMSDGERSSGYSRGPSSRYDDRERSDPRAGSPSGSQYDERSDPRARSPSGSQYDERTDTRGATDYRAPTQRASQERNEQFDDYSESGSSAPRSPIDAEFDYVGEPQRMTNTVPPNNKEPAGFYSTGSATPLPNARALRMSNAAESYGASTPLNHREPAGDWGTRSTYNDFEARTRAPARSSSPAYGTPPSAGRSAKPLDKEPGWKVPPSQVIIDTPVSERARMAAARSSSREGEPMRTPQQDRPEMMSTGTNFLDRKSPAATRSRTPPAPSASGRGTVASPPAPSASGRGSVASPPPPPARAPASSSASGSASDFSRDRSSSSSDFSRDRSSSSTPDFSRGSSSSSSPPAGAPATPAPWDTGSSSSTASSSSRDRTGMSSSSSSGPATPAPWETASSPATASSSSRDTARSSSPPAAAPVNPAPWQTTGSSPAPAPAPVKPRDRSGSSTPPAAPATPAPWETAASSSSSSSSSPANPAPWETSSSSPTATPATKAPWETAASTSSSSSSTSNSSPTATPATKAPWETASSPSPASASSPPAPSAGRGAWSGDSAPAPKSAPAPAPSGRAAWSGDADSKSSSDDDANTAAGTDYLSAMGGGPPPKKNDGPKKKPKMATGGTAGAMGQWDPSAL